jgi:DNA-binding transcriptional ArsR family regulator
MRPLFHPSIEDVTVEAILHALSDPVRVAIFLEIEGSHASQICADFLNISETPTNKSTVSRHLKVLREAGLVRGERRGVEMYNRSRCLEIDKRFPGLLASIVAAHTVQLRGKSRPNAAGKRKPTSRSARGRSSS